MVQVREYELRLPGTERPVRVDAAVWYDRGVRVEIKKILTEMGNEVAVEDLPRPQQERFIADLKQAERIRQDVGYVTCPHGRYLVRESCSDCLATAHAAIAAASDIARRSTVPLIRESEAGAFIVGSGVLFEAGNHQYLVTSATVARDIGPLGLGIPVGEVDSEIWRFQTAQVHSIDSEEHDIALVRLDDDPALVRELRARRAFLTLDRVALRDLPDYKTFYLHGFTQNASFTDGRLNGKPFRLLTTRYEGPVNGGLPVDPRVHLLVRPVADARLRSRETVNLSDLAGISGCGLWVIQDHQSADVWIPNEAVKLIGVQTSAIGGRWIRATSWVLVANALKRLDPALGPTLDAAYGASVSPSQQLIRQGSAQLEAGNLDAAIDILSEAIARNGRAVSAWNLRGVAWVRKRETTRALQDFDRALELEPTWVPALNNRGALNRELGDLKNARVDLERAVILYPHYAVAWANLASLLDDLGEGERAEECYGTALRLAPGLAMAYSNRADLRERRGNLIGALEDSSRSIELNSMRAAPFLIRASIRQKMGDLDGSLADASAAIELDASNPDGFIIRGQVRFRKGDLDGSIQDFSQGCELAPREAVAWANRGAAGLAAEQFEAASRDLNRALELQPRNASALAGRGMIQRRRGDLEAAERDLTAAVEIDSNMAAAWNNLGIVRMERGQALAAVAAFSRAIAITPSAAQFCNRAEAYEHTGEVDRAIQDFSMALELDPTNRVASQKLKALFAKNRTEPAQTGQAVEDYGRIFDTLDSMLANKSPTAADAQALMTISARNLTMLAYFFDRLSNSSWLLPLRQVGAFAHAPEPVEDALGQTVSFPPWPQSRFLARLGVIEEAQDVLLEIVLELASTRNVRVRADILDVALRIGPSKSVRLVSQTIAWLTEPDSRVIFTLPEKLAAFGAHLATGGHVKEATDLARHLLALRAGPPTTVLDVQFPGEPIPLFEPERYRRILTTDVAAIAAVAPDEVLVLVSDLLEHALRLHVGDRSAHRDRSDSWRPAIEDHEQNHGFYLRDHLVTSVRDVATLLLERRPEAIDEVVTALEHREWTIFRRLALHVLRLHAPRAWETVRARLLDRSLLADQDVWHEYALLARASFPMLAPGDQAALLALMRPEPDQEHLKRVFAFLGRGEPTEKDVRDAQRYELRRRLAILADVLAGEARAEYDALLRELGEPEHPFFHSYWVRMRAEHAPVAAEELTRLTPSELLKYLSTWKPRDDRRGPSREGLASAVRNTVRDNPSLFAAVADRLSSQESEYVAAFLSGLHESAKPLPWADVLSVGAALCRDPRFADLQWASTRAAFSELLGKGLNATEGGIPIEDRGRVWHLLGDLTRHERASTPVRFDDGAGFDAPTDGSQTRLGRVLRTALYFAGWVARTETPSTRGLAAEVRAVFDEMLVDRDPAAGIARVVLGGVLPWLEATDREWFATALPRILPRGELDQWRCAWEPFVMSRQASRRMFSLLAGDYKQAVELLDPTPRKSPSTYERHLGIQIFGLYTAGVIDIDSPIIATLFQRASVTLRRECFQAIGWEAEANGAEPDQFRVQRLKRLWEARVEAAKSARPERSDLAAFGWWFASGAFDAPWSFRQLEAVLSFGLIPDPDFRVVDRLADLVTQFPADTIRALEHLVVLAHEGWLIEMTAPKLRLILQTALEDEDARKDAVALIKRLLSYGRVEFRDLLPVRD